MVRTPLTMDEAVRGHAERIRDVGPVALGELFDLSAQRLVRYAATITRHLPDAEDAVQTVLVRIAAGPKCLIEARGPWAYLITMVRNESRLVLRRRRPWRCIESIGDALSPAEPDRLVVNETQRAVWAALKRLPPNQREVVVLKIWESMTFAEIGEVLEISPDTAASRYRYGLGKLQRHLGPTSVTEAAEASSC